MLVFLALVVNVMVAVVVRVVVVSVLAFTLQLSLAPPFALRSLGVYRHIHHGEVSSLELFQSREVNDPGFAAVGKGINHGKVRLEHSDVAECNFRLLRKLSPSRLPWCLTCVMRAGTYEGA
jgi:hypothetical protein